MARKVIVVFLAVVLTIWSGCTSVPYRGVNPQNPQFERGHSIPPIDLIANVAALPYKLLFWNWRLQSHMISDSTEADLTAFLEQHEADDVKVFIAKFSLFEDMGRLFTNKMVAWPFRIFPGFFTTFISTLTDWLIGGDYYNPFTNSIHLFSDISAVALHEGGHAVDFKRHKYRGTYAMMRILPAADTYQEWIATEEAIRYYQNEKQLEKELKAYKILYPAYGSYVGGALSIFVPLPYVTSVAGVLVGHIWGRLEAKHRFTDAKRIEQLEENYKTNENGSKWDTLAILRGR